MHIRFPISSVCFPPQATLQGTTGAAIVQGVSVSILGQTFFAAHPTLGTSSGVTITGQLAVTGQTDVTGQTTISATSARVQATNNQALLQYGLPSFISKLTVRVLLSVLVLTCLLLSRMISWRT